MAEVENVVLLRQSEILERVREAAAIRSESVETALIRWIEDGFTLIETVDLLPCGEYEV